MRVRFPRLPDHERAYALVERDDGAVYRLYGGLAGARLPHEIVDRPPGTEGLFCRRIRLIAPARRAPVLPS